MVEYVVFLCAMAVPGSLILKVSLCSTVVPTDCMISILVTGSTSDENPVARAGIMHRTL